MRPPNPSPQPNSPFPRRFSSSLLLAATLALPPALQADDHGNELAAATPVAAADLTDVVQTAAEQDWFRTEIPAPGRTSVSQWPFTEKPIHCRDEPRRREDRHAAGVPKGL